MIELLFSKAGLYVTGALATLIAFVAAYFKGKNKGKKEGIQRGAEEIGNLIARQVKKHEETRDKFHKLRDDIRSKHPDEL